MKRPVIGPGQIATPYGTALADLLGTKNLSEAVIASAFLTMDGAERLVDALRGAPKHAKVIVVIGSMAGFTRKAAIRYLQSFVSGRKRRLVPAIMKLIHPFEEDPRTPCFHVKASYARVGRRRHIAIVGSHNLSDEGLDSEGELGVWLEGKPAGSIGEALGHWVQRGTSWSEYVRQYKDAKRIPGLRQRKRHRQEGVRGYSDVAPLVEMEPLSGAEGSRFDRLCSEHDAIHNDDRCAPAVLVERIEAPPAGSVFDVVDHTDSHDDWGIGARRGIAEAIRYFPDAKSREGLLVYRWLRRYRVTPEAIRIAKACGVFKTEQAMGKQLWKFEQKLRSNNILRWS